jgi:60 kDa SS-A/Ro ribonucleoprotein
VRAVSELPFGGTDCSLPMRWAEQQKIKADAFCVLTDSETWAGSVHPSQALVSYRQKMNRPQAKAVVCGLVSNGFSIADPADRNQLDVIGFDVAVPQLVVDFISGNVA